MKAETFDLNLAVLRWRENLAQSPAFRTENLNELESHLRDSVATLRAHGLSDEEAFLIASRRIGNGQQLQIEFGKVNRTATWADRILWMLIGFQIWALVSDLVSAVTLPVKSLTLGITLEMILPPLALGLLTLAVWKGFAKCETKAPVTLERWLARPFALAAGLFVFAVGAQTGLGFFRCFFLYPRTPDSSVVWEISPQFLSVYVLAAGLTFVFARKRLRQSLAVN